MVHYNLAGRVNSEEYAVCDRLLGAFVSWERPLLASSPIVLTLLNGGRHHGVHAAGLLRVQVRVQAR